MHTTTNEGLIVTASKGSQIYPISLKMTDDDLVAVLKLFREPSRSEWNNPIKPQAE
ncbi:hypothetical protein KSX_02810 [Ktedonospora formicarum]|uniref:Uncharacterized protein n=1 Tax=Ktedonospora formicarum TaxID=2778364 RepID=A0A8J3MQ06_9CHLR|nr:hypothetical protein KSX_02810 [Ktedonospora formicarum]